MNSRKPETPFFRFMYGVGLPVVMAVLLIICASILQRPKIGGEIFDFLLRCGIFLWFYLVYRRLSRLSTYSFYPDRIWSKEDVTRREKYIFIGKGLLLGFVGGFLTWWSFIKFLNIGEILPIFLGVLNWVIISTPAIKQYWVYKV